MSTKFNMLRSIFQTTGITHTGSNKERVWWGTVFLPAVRLTIDAVPAVMASTWEWISCLDSSILFLRHAWDALIKSKRRKPSGDKDIELNDSVLILALSSNHLDWKDFISPHLFPVGAKYRSHPERPGQPGQPAYWSWWFQSGLVELKSVDTKKYYLASSVTVVASLLIHSRLLCGERLWRQGCNSR